MDGPNILVMHAQSDIMERERNILLQETIQQEEEERREKEQ
jgi:hypothetical protein